MRKQSRRVLGDGLASPARGGPRSGFRTPASNVCHTIQLPGEWRETVRVRRRARNEGHPLDVTERLDDEPRRPRVLRVVRSAPVEPEPPRQPELPPIGVLDLGEPGEPVRERVRRILSALGSAPHLTKLEEGVVTVLLQELERERDQLKAPDGLDPHEAQLYERRIAKLSKALEDARASIQRLAGLKNVDPGLASVYREVQGLDPADESFELKQEMMSHIFLANLELQQALRKSG